MGSQRGLWPLSIPAPASSRPSHPPAPFAPSIAAWIGLVRPSAACPPSSSGRELPMAGLASLGHHCVLDLGQCLAQGPLRREQENGIWAFEPGGAAPPRDLGSVCFAGDRSEASGCQPGVAGGRFLSQPPSRQDVEEATHRATHSSPRGPREQTIQLEPRGRPALCAGTRVINRRHISGGLFGAKRHAPGRGLGPRTPAVQRWVAERSGRGGAWR